MKKEKKRKMKRRITILAHKMGNLCVCVFLRSSCSFAFAFGPSGDDAIWKPLATDFTAPTHQQHPQGAIEGSGPYTIYRPPSSFRETRTKLCTTAAGGSFKMWTSLMFVISPSLDYFQHHCPSMEKLS